MTSSGEGSDLPPQVQELLSLESIDRQMELLVELGELDSAGVLRLLAEAEELIGRHPNRAARLAHLGAVAADALEAGELVPRAHYLEAQACAVDGRLERALGLIESARSEYTALGDHENALRTNLGLVHVLVELGLHREALEAGDTVLAAARGESKTALSLTEEEKLRLIATAMMNRGVCLEKLGRYGEALAGYEEAGHQFEALGDKTAAAKALVNRGIVHLNMGEVTRALKAFQAAAVIHEGTGQSRWHANAQINIGNAYMLLGSFALGLEAFETAAKLLAEEGEPVSEPILLLDTAEAYLSLNLYPEALAAYRDAEEELKIAGMVDHRARALRGLGAALLAATRYDESEAALRQAEELYTGTGNLPRLAGVLLERSILQEYRGLDEDALTLARRALEQVSDQGWPVQEAFAHMRLADLLLPDTRAAEPHLLEARSIARRLHLPSLKFGLDQRLGHLRLLQGRSDEARELLVSAVDRIESLRGATKRGAVRTSYLRDKSAAYEDLVHLHLDSSADDAVREAFTAAEAYKSRSLVELLSGLVEPQPARQEDREVASKLSALRGELNAVYSEWLGSDVEAGRSFSQEELQTRALELEQEISLLELQTGKGASALSPFAAPLTVDDTLTKLLADEALLEYYIDGDELLAFVAGHDRLEVVRRVGSVARVQGLLQKLSAQLDRFRAGADFVARHSDVMERSTKKLLTELHGELLAGVDPILSEIAVPTDESGAAKLAVIPHGILHQVPFHALYDGSAYVIDRYEVTYAPSATVWALCQRPGDVIGRRALIVGVADPKIPLASEEARLVAERCAESRELIGDAATCDAVLREAPGYDLIHLACHGLFRADNPMFSSLKLADGWLTAGEVMRTELQAALVTLSACESGRGEVVGGDEVLGLTRAFLSAGAAGLVVSLWLVHDEAATRLMDQMYANLALGASRAAALREASLAIRKEHSHPYYWAPFTLVGRR